LGVHRWSPKTPVGIIANGRKRMPKYAGKLSVEEIDPLVQQIKAMNQK
jgi:hypothetical protein